MPNGRDFWLLTHEDGSDRFVVFPITAQGVGEPAFYVYGPIYDGYKYSAYAQISPDRTMMAFNLDISRNFDGHINETSPLELYDFDAKTGKISNRRVLGNFPSIKTLIFSPDNTKLYMGSYNWEEPALYSKLWQYDLSAGSLDKIIQSLESIT